MDSRNMGKLGLVVEKSARSRDGFEYFVLRHQPSGSAFTLVLDAKNAEQVKHRLDEFKTEYRRAATEHLKRAKMETPEVYKLLGLAIDELAADMYKEPMTTAKALAGLDFDC